MLPAKTILAIIALICAALFFAGVVRPGGMLPGVGFGLLVLSAILIGGVYPAAGRAVPGQAEPAGQGAAVHRVQHRRDAGRLRRR